MASRVTVTVNVRDNSRAGIRAVRNQIRRMNDDIRRSGSDAQFRVSVNAASARRAARTVRRLRTQLSHPGITFNTTVRAPDGNRTNRMLRSMLTRPFRSAGSFLGGVMSDGIGQGLLGAIRGGGPVLGTAVAAVLVAAIVGALSLIGGALSGLLITALGAAFVGIAGISAATSDKVKQTWKGAAESMKENFKSVGEPLIPVLDRAIQRLQRMSDELAPKFKFAMEQAAGASEVFINKLIDGFASFGREAFAPIMEAWKVFAPVFGDVWDEFMTNLGSAFADMATLVKEHPTEIAAALRVVFDIIVLLIQTITFFGQAWATGMQAGIDAAAFLMEAWANVQYRIIEAMAAIVSAAATSFGWIPGIGDKLKAADRAMGVWRDNARSHMDNVKAKADEMRGTLDRANRKRKLEADVTQWTSQMGVARASLKKTMSQEARKRITANINDLQAKVRQAKVELAMLRDKVVNVTVRNLYDSSLNRHAKGGVVGTAATGGVRSNMTLVGEQGPEIADLAPGSHVRSNSDSRRLARGMGGGGGGSDRPVYLVVDGKVIARAMFDPFREEIRDRGGNVQASLGQRGK